MLSLNLTKNRNLVLRDKLIYSEFTSPFFKILLVGILLTPFTTDVQDSWSSLDSSFSRLKTFLGSSSVLVIGVWSWSWS
ncbi:unnamed protein product [Meloidogyne enterolobii]|uniref:Uncharacterized protein n=1 Tax=Meloidogyne enterolobii TaxID=390850 RepID=A0ACB0ZTR0_MELEN